ncbi:insulin receptor substrate 4-like [Canis lupus familiaris]|uniref:insulin receptor substrate 4-like n=1 Tax=Canis lupus familiaris TaxID=9615 RepID=UPI0018F44A7D|nr:insulin receptor substrate 4-like [Canis lupus familiaris]XP_038439213.1 insulin receptor substrate 4-like [Canis lupus familiaris]
MESGGRKRKRKGEASGAGRKGRRAGEAGRARRGQGGEGPRAREPPGGSERELGDLGGGGEGKGGPGTSWFAPVAGAASDLCVRLLFQGTARALRWLYRKCELRLGPVWVGTRARRPPPPAPPGFPPREARAVGLGRAGGTRVRESRREARGTAGGKGKGRLRRIRPVHPCTPVPATGRSSGSAGDPVMLQPLKLQLILCRIPPREDCDQSYPLRHAAQPGNNHRISCQYFLTTNMEPEVGVQEKG